MKTSNKGIELIKHFESLKLEPYKCSAGIPTIGWGSTKYENGRKVSMNDKPISEKKAHDLFMRTLPIYEKVVLSEFKGTELTQDMFDSLVSFAYNTGSFKFNRGRSTYTFASYLKADAIKFKKDVCDFMMSVSKYYDQRTKNYETAKGLRRRRMSEVILMYTGELVFYVNGSWNADKVSVNYERDTGVTAYNKLGL